MQVWNGLGSIPADLGPTVVTLGNFDGVHRGHRAVVEQVVEQAAARGARSVAVTFDPHPVSVLRPERAPRLLTSLAQRLALLESTGLDAVLVLPFTPELARQTPEEFVTTVFVGALHASAVVVGEDMRFGRGNSGDVGTLTGLGQANGFDVLALPNLGDGTRWSSSLVRTALGEGDVATAAAVLGRPHRVTGTVVHGDHRGRELGFPTANLGQDTEGLVPADGVYAGWMTRLDLPTGAPDQVLAAAISVGTNPTFHGTQRRVEAYALDRTDLELYGERVTYEFVRLLRPTLTFDSVAALVEQMKADCVQCREILTSIVPS